MVDARLRSIGTETGSASSLPTGTLTFMLTDEEASSRLWDVDPAAASAVLERRQEIIRAATARYGGVLPVEQGEGDSSVSAFTRASDAAACAVHIQQAVGSERWPGDLGVRIRIALHTGEADVHDGTYFGPALNRCARLRSVGHGGQILVSQATYEVLVDGLPDGVVLRDLGVHRLRDLARPEHIWEMRHPGLLDTFPPLRSVDAVANNLPVQLTSFVGRQAEIESVRGLLTESRLVTLTGAGGSGKTRLALQVAAAVLDDYPDGVWWVDLAPLADPSLVPSALAALLGVRESPLESVIDTVVRYLGERRALVMLDNCEHLIEACAHLATRIVHGCPQATVLATSRELLGVSGESTLAVPPLSLPSSQTPELLIRCEAARLFVDRARTSRPNFAITSDNAPAVAEICTRLDGIPLALELAAGRVRVLNVDQIASGLAERFHLLTGGARSALPRQRTLEGSVDWSHDLLSELEQVVFRRLAAFAGTFTLDAAEAVCAGNDVSPDHVLDVLSSLVDRSLVQVDDIGSQTRYRLLETIRDYARHKLTDAGEAENVRDRHLDHYISFARQAATGLEGPDLVAWLTRVDAELDNVRAAMDWSARSAAPGRGVCLVGLLTLYWFSRSELRMGRARLEATLEHGGTEMVQHPDRASALTALCMVAYRGGDMTAARRFGDEAVTIARRVGDAHALGRALHFRAWVRYWGEPDPLGAWEDFDEASALLRRAEDRVFEGLNLAVFGWSLAGSSEGRRARAVLDEALTLGRTSSAQHGLCIGLVVLGWLGSLEGDLERGERYLEDGLVVARAIGDHYVEVCARTFLAVVKIGLGRYREARNEAERALAMALEHRSPNNEAMARTSLGVVALTEGDLEAAAAELEASTVLFSEVMPGLTPLSRGAEALVALARSRHDDAARYADDALALGRRTDNTLAIGSALYVQAGLARVDGDAQRAEDLLHEALDLAYRLGHRPRASDMLETLGDTVAEQGRFEEAVRLWAAAEGTRDAMHYVPFMGDQHQREEDIARARHTLGTTEFDTVWAEGATLSLDDAVAYARRGRGERKRPAHGWDSLTPSELQVVDLVAEGLTNPQIGERLFVSRRTVQAHLSHVFAKLGVSTRAELATKTAQRRRHDP